MTEGGSTAFADFWRAQEAEPFGSTLFWSATRPFYGGDASLPDPREPSGRWSAQATRCIHLGTHLDGRALTRNQPWTEAVVALFVETAAQLGAFYAGAYVERNVIASRGRISFGPDTESLVLSRKWWEGLPPDPTWMAWFGEPYRELVQDSVAGHVSETRAEGILLRLGDLPLNRDELAPLIPRLPHDLVWTRRRNEADDREETPARQIPTIE